MEFDLSSFTNTLRQVIYDYFPYGPLDNPNGTPKYPNRQGHVKDIAFMNLNPIHSFDTITFDIGSPQAEENYPHYHILEDSQVIHIKGKGTKQSKGSQDKISDKRARDYGIVKWNGKTYSQEYKKNVRGVRSKVSKSRQKAYFVDDQGVVYKTDIGNSTASTYVNIHYKYIEKSIEKAIPILCATYNLKALRVKNNDLGEEYGLQGQSDMGADYVGNIIDILDSFN